jgi:NADH dehydrogenase
MKNIVVLGAGFGGLSAVRVLSRYKNVNITLIDERNYCLFLPLLYQVAVGALGPNDIALPIRSLFSRKKNVHVLQQKVLSIDMNSSCVKTSEGQIPYDYLISACGAKQVYFGHNDWEQYAPGLKTLEQAQEIRDRILSALERAETTRDNDLRTKLLTFIIIGGGPTGVELAGAIAEMLQNILSMDFRTIDPKAPRIILIEAAPRILAPFSPALSEKAMSDLKALGVDVRISSPVTGIDAEGVKINGSTIKAGTMIWAAGIRASSLNETIGPELDRQGRIHVNADLSLPNHPNVFIVGDQACCLDAKTSKPLGALASVAMQQGECAAKNIIRTMNDRTRLDFNYVDRGQAATIGQGRAIVESGKLKLTGPIAWLIWLGIHLWFLTGLENKLTVMVKWLWTYIGRRHGARIILSDNWKFYN